MIYPYFDLDRLFRATKGRLEGLLVDAGMDRPFVREYDFETRGDEVHISPRKTHGGRAVVLPARLSLTPELLAFLGLYSGDGNKTGQVGFAQRNVYLLEAACRGLRTLFGDSGKLAVNLLNDSRYYMRPEFFYLAEAAGLNQNDFPTIDPRTIPTTIREHFWSEFQSEVALLPLLRSIETYSATISPKKGARVSGGESREYIVNLVDSRWLLPLLLLIIEQVNETLVHDQRYANLNGEIILDWGTRPSLLVYQRVDLREHLTSSPYCRWFSTAGQEIRYRAVLAADGSLEVGTNRFHLPRVVSLGPLSSYAAGLYLAEGTTDKDIMMNFHEPTHPGSVVALSFNSSENSSLAIFLCSLKECLGDLTGAIASWKVKVGSQYMYEMQVIGELYQAPMTRKGRKGQGVSPSCVQAGLAREWALKEFSALRGAEDAFSHIEYTGAGIMRVQVNCSSALARLLFSLYELAVGSLLRTPTAEVKRE